MLTRRANQTCRVMLWTALLCSNLSASVLANDGGITFGGSPRLLAGKTTVSMQSEAVRMTVGAETVTVDCQFVFRNNGPACSVRMGFPDWQRGDSGSFTSFQSYVDGKSVPTRFVRDVKDSAKDRGDLHVETVTFPAHGARRVRDCYTSRGLRHVWDYYTFFTNNMTHWGPLSQAFYVLETGASWYGPIGRTDVYVTFNRPEMASPLIPKPLKPPSVIVINNGPYQHADPPERPGTVIYHGPCKPTVQGETLHFFRTNWHPTNDDNILLYFGFQALQTVGGVSDATVACCRRM